MAATPQQVIGFLEAVSPCEIVEELPDLPVYDGNHRSSYWPKTRGRWATPTDLIYMNEGPARSWRYAQVLAHEVGHALDYHRKHPLQGHLSGRRGRYRAEAAAVAYEHGVVHHFRLPGRLHLVRRRLVASHGYVNRYQRPDGLPTVGQLCSYFENGTPVDAYWKRGRWETLR